MFDVKVGDWTVHTRSSGAGDRWVGSYSITHCDDEKAERRIPSTDIPGTFATPELAEQAALDIGRHLAEQLDGHGGVGEYNDFK